MPEDALTPPETVNATAAWLSTQREVTKEKFKTKATETFAKVVKGAKKGVVKARSARNFWRFLWGETKTVATGRFG